jgi:transmembrane sensor
MEAPERIWQLMAKALNSETSSQEKDELLNLLRENPAFQQQYELITRIWIEREHENKDEEDAKRHILKIINRAETETINEEMMTNQRRRIRRRRLFAGVSFALAALFVSGWFLFRNTSSLSATSSAIAENEILVAKKGSRTRSFLPDGTTVWLNAGSQLHLKTDFTGATREVMLEGEAFFDVVKNPGRPFIVHTSGIDIKVLGTAFNVKAYPGEKTVETTLLRGLVQVFDQKNPSKAPIELRPNQKLILPRIADNDVEANEDSRAEIPVVKEIPVFGITRIDSTKKENERIETAWVYSRLEFRGDNFETLARKLERWYNVSIIFNDDKVKQLNFNGSFEKETVEQAFAALKEAKSFSYQINNKHEIFVGSAN